MSQVMDRRDGEPERLKVLVEGRELVATGSTIIVPDTVEQFVETAKGRKLGLEAPVAQWIERSPPEREVACSNHAGRVELFTCKPPQRRPSLLLAAPRFSLRLSTALLTGSLPADSVACRFRCGACPVFLESPVRHRRWSSRLSRFSSV
jgi:hypothetical protein